MCCSIRATKLHKAMEAAAMEEAMDLMVEVNRVGVPLLKKRKRNKNR